MTPIPGSIIQMLADRGKKTLQAPGMRALPQPASIPGDPGIWYGSAPRPVRRGITRPMDDRPLYAFAGGEPLPTSEDSPQAVWINSACPPWICPSVWAVAMDIPVLKCIPWYEVQEVVGCFDVPRDYLVVIKDMSYEAANAAQDDVVAFQLFVNDSLKVEWEDIITDALQPNPVHRFGISGHVRSLPCHIVVPTSSQVCIKATLRGPINLAGVSPYWPGQPITTGDCHVTVNFNGWFFPAMANVDGSPRQGALGDNRLVQGGF